MQPLLIIILRAPIEHRLLFRQAIFQRLAD
jgi:hypothetical protein